MRSRAILFILLSAAFCFSCTKGGSDDSGGDSPAGPGEVRTDCGIVQGEELRNPVAIDSGKKGTIKNVSDIDLFIVSLDKGDVLVKLLGIGPAAPDMKSLGIKYIEEVARNEVTLFEPGNDPCPVAVSGGTALMGEIITKAGTSLAEDLIKKGYVSSLEPTGSCGQGMIGSCYQALKDSAPPILGVINDFLWKPESDGEKTPGKLVVLVSACNADIVVNGEHLDYDSPSSGRCTLSRSTTKSGCDFGNNVRVEVFDRDGGGVYAFPDGNLYYTVTSGCTRQEFKE